LGQTQLTDSSKLKIFDRLEAGPSPPPVRLISAITFFNLDTSKNTKFCRVFIYEPMNTCCSSEGVKAKRANKHNPEGETKMKIQTITRNLTLVAVFSLTPGALMAAEEQASFAVEKEGIELINRLEGVASDVRYHAARLQTVTLDLKTSKWVHFHHLTQIKDLVNEGLRPALTRLEEIQPELPEWKQKSIDRMLVSASALAADANAAILNKNDSGVTPAVLNATYRQQINTIYAHSDALVKAADAAGDYARARLKAAEVGLISRK
jgi:hypothetical protein